MNSKHSMYVFMSSLLALFFLAITVNASASNNFVIEEGEVFITPSFCPPEKCEEQSAKLSGEFTSKIDNEAERIYFPSSDLQSSPDLDFQLPIDPDLDSGGTVRDVSFQLSGSKLEVKGVIDSRAFDGPLIEYWFRASMTEEEFDPRGFYTARPDFRKCISPLCGGYFVKKVNRRYTRCADGSVQRECYVAELSLPKGTVKPSLGFNDYLLVQGNIKAKDFPGFGNLGEFVAKNAWRSTGEKSSRGRFVGIQNNGILCITSPCFSFDQYYLNRKFMREISSYNLDKAGAEKEEIEQAHKLLGEGEVLPAVGINRRVKGFAGTGIEFTASNFFLPLETEKRCAPGYDNEDGVCVTTYGCEYPLLELTAYPGVEGAPIQRSCVKSCEFPAQPNGPGHCVIFYP